MACRQYYDGLCNGGPCEICRVKEHYIESVQTPDQMIFIFGAAALMILASVLFASALVILWAAGGL